LQDRLLLHPKNYHIFTTNANLKAVDKIYSRKFEQKALTAQVPFLTASKAYSTWDDGYSRSPPDLTLLVTWNKWPSGEKTVRATPSRVNYKGIDACEDVLLTSIVGPGHCGRNQ
jgi:hypothetical protein